MPWSMVPGRRMAGGKVTQVTACLARHPRLEASITLEDK
jgi:hypothetical protein